MKNITVSDMTLAFHKGLSFKERIEVARKLDELKVNAIYMPRLENVKTDSLLIRTVSAFVKNSIIAVPVGVTEESVRDAAAAIQSAKQGRLVVSMPVSPVGMEYTYHKKAPKVLELAKQLFAASVAASEDVEFFAEDATRADMAYLRDIIDAAVKAGVRSVTLCDDEGILLPDEFSLFLTKVKNELPALASVKLSVLCKDTNGMATASAVMALKTGVDDVKCCVGVSEIPSLETFSGIMERTGDRLGVKTSVNTNELHRITKSIAWVLTKGEGAMAQKPSEMPAADTRVFDINDTKETVANAVRELGYDLHDEDLAMVYEEFCRLAEKKTVTVKDLEAVVASVALQVTPTYTLKSYVINNGNIISSSAQITLEKDGKALSGIAMGDGPIDAAFRTVEEIIGRHFELDNFQIQAVTEGQEAVGSALVRLLSDGKLYSGNGISTDIIGASIRAFLAAVNKIVYEEENK